MIALPKLSKSDCQRIVSPLFDVTLFYMDSLYIYNIGHVLQHDRCHVMQNHDSVFNSVTEFDSVQTNLTNKHLFLDENLKQSGLLFRRQKHIEITVFKVKYRESRIYFDLYL